jgi:hypothetical protein
MSIYVGNLSYEVTETDLNTVFSDYGSVKRVHVPTDRETGRPRGFAFVELLFLGANNLSTSAKIFLYLSRQMRIAVI